MAVRIVTDSSCDLAPDMIRDFGITVLPHYIMFGEKSCQDGINISRDEIFSFVQKGGTIPKTAAVSVQDYSDCFSRIREEHPEDEIVCITVSSKMSDCFANACEAASRFRHVYAVDSQNLSTGLGQVVVTGAELAEQGQRGLDIKKTLETDIIPHVDASFILDRLDYLYKGGRCSAVKAISASLLKLRLCIAVRDGELQVVRRYRGSFENCVEQYVKDCLQDRDDVQMHRIFITHSNVPRKSVQIAEDNVRLRGKFEHIDETNTGCTVSSHCGPNAIGLLFLRK